MFLYVSACVQKVQNLRYANAAIVWHINIYVHISIFEILSQVGCDATLYGMFHRKRSTWGRLIMQLCSSICEFLDWVPYEVYRIIWLSTESAVPEVSECCNCAAYISRRCIRFVNSYTDIVYGICVRFVNSYIDIEKKIDFLLPQVGGDATLYEWT